MSPERYSIAIFIACLTIGLAIRVFLNQNLVTSTPFVVAAAIAITFYGFIKFIE